MAAENRTLQIKSTFRDQASPEFRKLQVAANAAASRIVAGFRGTVGVLTNVRSAVVALLGAFTVVRAVQAVQAVAESLDNLAKTSDRLGITAESLQQVRDQAELAGLKFEELTKGLTTFSRNVEQAQRGSATQAQALRDLGLRAEEFTGSQLDAVDVMAKVADGLKGVQGATERTRILVDLFGESGAKLGSLLRGGGEGIRQLAAEAKAAGIVFSRDELARVEAYNDSLTRVRQAFRDLAAGILVEVSPVLSTFFNDLAAAVRDNSGQIRKWVVDVSASLVDMLEAVAKAAVELGAALEKGMLFIDRWRQRVEMTGTIAKRSWALLFGTDEEVQRLEAQGMAQVTAFMQAGDQMDLAGQQAEERVRRLSAAFDALRQRIEAARNAQAQPAAQPDVPGKPGKPPAQADRGIENLQLGIAKAASAWRDFDQAAFTAGQQLVNGPLAAFEDSLANVIAGTKSAKEAWRDFGRATVQILAQVIAKLITVKILSAFFGPSFGEGAGITVARARGGVDPGGVTDLVPLRRFARGGVVRQPTLALIGEGAAPAEAFVPLPDGRSIPVEFAGGGAAAGGTTHVYITAMDSRDVVRVLSEQRGLLRMFSADDLDRRVDVRQHTRKAVR